MTPVVRPHTDSRPRRAIRTVVGALASLVLVAGCARPPGVDGDLNNGWAPMAAPSYTGQAVGECYSGRSDLWFTVNVTGLNLVKCTEPHVVEVVALRELPDNAATTDRPTTTSVAYQTAYQECSAAASSYLGADWHTAKTYPVVWLPSFGAWHGGNHRYTCAVAADPMDADEPTPWTASVKDVLRDPVSPLGVGCVKIEGTGVDKDGFYETLKAFHWVACTQPHDGEFSGARTAPAGKYASSDADQQRFAPLCEEAAMAFLGQTRSQWNRYTAIRIMWTSPSEQLWNVDDRTVRCYVQVSSKHLIGTSLRGLGTAPLPPKVG